MVRTGIIYCHNSVHNEGEKERHVPCEEFGDAAEIVNEYRVADYPCPKCECTEDEYLPEHGRPWSRTRDRVISQITAKTLDLVYGDREEKKRESKARIERLRTIGYGENRAWELAANLEKELEGGNHDYKQRARRIAERVREDLEGVDVARMRDDAKRLAQRLRNNVEATDEGSNDTWEHMNFCLEKDSTKPGAKSKRLKIFPDERERVENAEKDKPEQYQTPKVELIFHWDHNQQGRPPSKKQSRRAFPFETNSALQLLRLSQHMKVDLPQARQAYEDRRIWNESRKRNREALDRDEENDVGSIVPTPGVGQRTDIGPRAKRRPQTNRVRRGGAAANRPGQWGAARAASPLYTDNVLASEVQDFEWIRFSPTASSMRQQSLRPIAPSINEEDPTAGALSSLMQTGVIDPQYSINQPNFSSLDPSFVSSPPLITSSAGLAAAGSTYPAPPNPSLVSYSPSSVEPRTGSEGNFGFNASYPQPSEGATRQRTQRQREPPSVTRTRMDATHRSSSFNHPSPGQRTRAWPRPQVHQANQYQVLNPTGPQMSQVQGDLTEAGLVPSDQHDPRPAEPAYTGANQGASPTRGYGYQAPWRSVNAHLTSPALSTGLAPPNVLTEHIYGPLHTYSVESLETGPSSGLLAADYHHENAIDEYSASDLRGTASYESSLTDQSYPSGIPMQQSFPGPVSVASSAAPYSGTYYSEDAMDPHAAWDPDATGNSYNPADQPDGPANVTYDFAGDENDLLDLVNQGLPQ